MNIPAPQQTVEMFNELAQTDMDEPEFVIHLSRPMFFERLEGAYNIGWVHWGTLQIKDEWADMMNEMDEIWASSLREAEVFIRSGVTTPITVIPGPFDDGVFTENTDELAIEGVTFNERRQPLSPQERIPVVGMIAQWHKGSNIEDFLYTLCSSFDERECVVLLKTYVNKMQRGEDFDIRSRIQKIKEQVGNGPKVTFVTQMMADEQMSLFYNSVDVYCDVSRTSGVNMSVLQALGKGKPVVSIEDKAHPMSYYDDLHSDMFYPLNSTTEPVYGAANDDYTPSQWWSRVDCIDLMVKLREALKNVTNKTIDAEKINHTKDLTASRFGLDAGRTAILTRLTEIQKESEAELEPVTAN
jgi:hypothetical protein